MNEMAFCLGALLVYSLMAGEKIKVLVMAMVNFCFASMVAEEAILLTSLEKSIIHTLTPF